ncbi:MAG: DEAD/DEAH box helicase family protein [Terrisporobacter sp.]
MTNNIDNLFQAMNESINHSQYQANEIIEIDKYISEIQSGVINIIASAKGGETHLLIAPTGSGKSYTIINVLKQFNIKALFILPNSANVQQTMEEYNIYGAYDKLCAKNAITHGNVVALTWDKVSQLTDIDLSEHIIILDEIHQTYTDTYRNKAIKGLYEVSKRCKGRIDITATPNKLDFEIYDCITEYKQTIQTKYNVKMYNGIDTNTIINILNKSNNSALLMNDTKELKYISSMINKKSDVITSDTKEHSKLYNEIMIKSHMGDFKALLNTTTIVAGVNIKNPNITDVIVVGIKDIGTIKQYIARFRDLKECNVHILNNYQEECNIYEIEWLINKNIQEAEELKDFYNKTIKNNTEFSTFGFNINPINLDTNIYFNKDLNRYEIDTVYIRSQLYKNYYNKRTIESFKVLLNEYFENIELIYNLNVNEDIEADKKQFKADLNEAKKEAIQELEKYKSILVGYYEIKKDKPSKNLLDYLKMNNLNIEQIQKDYLKYGIHDLILNNSLKSLINLYTKYVLENSFSTELAWTLAQKKNNKKVFAKINTLIYKDLKREYPNAFSTDYSLEVKVYELITHYLYEGVSYTQEHLKDLSEALRIVFGDNWALSTDKIGKILNQIYTIEKKKVRNVPLFSYSFYKNILPKSGTSNLLNIYTIKSRIELSDIKKELGCTSSDKSLDHSIQKRKSKILDQLDSTQKEILLEGVF